MIAKSSPNSRQVYSNRFRKKWLNLQLAQIFALLSVFLQYMASVGFSCFSKIGQARLVDHAGNNYMRIGEKNVIMKSSSKRHICRRMYECCFPGCKERSSKVLRHGWNRQQSGFEQKWGAGKVTLAMRWSPPAQGSCKFNHGGSGMERCGPVWTPMYVLLSKIIT